MFRAPSILVDGVSSVAFHNGVNRVPFYRFDTAGSPQVVLDLMVPTAVSRGMWEVLTKLR